MVMRSSIEFLEASLAGSEIGAVPVPAGSHWTGDDLAHLLTDSGSKRVIVDGDLVSVVVAVLPPGMAVARVGGSTGGKYPDFESLISASEPIGAQVLDPRWVSSTRRAPRKAERYFAAADDIRSVRRGGASIDDDACCESVDVDADSGTAVSHGT